MNTRQKIWLRIVGVTMMASIPMLSSASEESELPVAIQTTGFIYGLGLIASEEAYKGYLQRLTPIPVIGYIGEKLKVLGPFISYKFAARSDWEFLGIVTPRFAGFDASDSAFFTGMSERKSSLNAGVSVQRQVNTLKVSLSAVADALGRNKGFESTFKIENRWNYGPFFFEPYIELKFQDQQLVNYYFEVQADEATTERPFYQASSDINSIVGLTFSTPVFFGGMTRATLSNEFYGDETADSPLLESDSHLMLFLTFSKFF